MGNCLLYQAEPFSRPSVALSLQRRLPLIRQKQKQKKVACLEPLTHLAAPSGSQTTFRESAEGNDKSGMRKNKNPGKGGNNGVLSPGQRGQKNET